MSLGKPIPHDSAIGHVTGAAPFIDDLPRQAGELLVGFVGSPVASGRIESLELDEARRVDGVVGIYTAADIPGQNRFGIHFHDEPFLADDELLYVEQPVVVIAAETPEALAAARRVIRINAIPARPIFTIEQAIDQQRYIGPPRRIRRGEPERAIAAAPHRLAGVFHSGGQEQFYLESQAALAYPGEDGQLTVHSSTQGPTEIQQVVAAALGLKQHEVICLCKRMGGAFGGKETQAAIPAALAALVAHKTGRAARLVYDKDQDMRATGKRHPFRSEWEVGFDEAGRILGIRFNLYADGGATADLSMAVLERAMMHADNAYFLPNAEINGRVCFTNYPSNTAFRGFGGPQAMAAMENLLHEIARHLDLDALAVQRVNLYGTGQEQPPRNITPYGQIVRRNHLPEIVTTLAERCEYKERLARIEAANQTDRLHLRGIALSPVKFGISFTTRFLNQANALVNVYTDGTVQVSTGATEMGQGVNTKIRQLVADELGIPWRHVLVMVTSTEKNINTSPTAASASTDLNGAAALDACRKIKRRLAAFAARRFASTEKGLCESPSDVVFDDGWVSDRRSTTGSERLSFGELCAQARLERIDLGARGFYATPGVDLNRETGQGNPFFYFTQGAAVAEVLIDRFTGELSVPRADLLIDIGCSINPGVDMGQITGGFIQGLGWVTGECLVYNEQGELLSHSPTTYKIPATTDVPKVFNCQLFENHDNVEIVYRSKAVGEPPLMHALCIWGAVKHALRCASPAAAAELRLPATGEEILRCLTLGSGGQWGRGPAAAVGKSVQGVAVLMGNGQEASQTRRPPARKP